MTRLSRDQLVAFVNQQRSSANDDVDLISILSQNVLAEYLGADWVYRYIRGPEGEYFRSTSQAPGDGFLFNDRMISLSELLFNLQDADGIGGVLRRLRGGEIEAAVAELEAAYFLKLCGIPFRFRVPQSSLGLDYDLEIDLPGHECLACEGKCKLEETSLTFLSMKYTFEKARTQLPKSSPRIILIKLPGSQMSETATRREVGRAVIDLFKRSGRVSGVVSWWEIWETRSDGGATKHVKFRNDANPRARTEIPMSAFEPAPRDPNWLDFLQLVGIPGGYRPA